MSPPRAAVATLATRVGTLGQAVQQGVAWGIGHTLALMLFGGVVLALGRSIPPDMERAPEPGVGVKLVALAIGMMHGMAGSGHEAGDVR